MILGIALTASAAVAAFGDRTPVADVAASTPRGAAAGHRPAKAEVGEHPAEPLVLRLIPRDALLEKSDSASTADENNVFASKDWSPPPPPPSVTPATPALAPAQAAPPLPFTYIGKSVEDGEWEVYLARGEQAYVVHEKSVIDDTYRVDAIAPPLLSLTYLPLNQAQQLKIGGFD